ncbi:site-specific recombinase [Acutalibacter sp. 1XD8-33]|uniref:recombinase family protein n=1 Tax=Acutalibacter sp. 1XD8-33 TaxID=2320081 RepID=UPI000EA3F356|nr:recombinase family protein [Acutalibacter sp. 1XD8-33]RKJ38495.1 site-specific recombinase [Acutalibacter sp. 1XD8-33]
MKRVFLYVRVSTEEQAVHGLSIEAQTAALENWAQANQCKVVGIYTDAGISARKPASKRPALQRLLAGVRAREGDLILFTKLDRWFRNISEYYKVQEVLERYHVSWKTIQEDYDTTTASGRLKVNIMLSVAQDEADRTGERIQFIFQDKVQRGEVISGKVPLGYKIENKKMVIDPATAPIARDIFQQYLALRSVRGVREYLIKTYHLTYAPTSLRLLLTNPRYIGHAHGQENFCPALIPKEQFEKCRDSISFRGQRNIVHSPNIYLFTGLLRCAECGNRLSAHVVSGQYIYYRCTKYEKYHQCTHKKRTSELALEKWLIENLVACYERYNLSLIEQAQRPAPKVDTENLRRKMKKLQDLYLNDLIEREDYEKEYSLLRDQLREASTPAPKLPSPVDIEEIKNMLAAYRQLNRKEQKEFWGRLVGEITITNDEHFFVFPFSHK